MSQYKGIDYSFQPESYWEDSSVLQALLRDVKGVQRRKMIIDYYENDAINELEDSLLKAKLTEDHRKRLGMIHPSFMGGEYLPDCVADETEIARIELQSTLADVTSIRARRESEEYVYSVVDEHDDTYSLFIESSIEPLTLAELIDFIDHSEQTGGWPGGLSLCYNNANLEGGLSRENLRHFTRITSEIYPKLETHYEKVFEDWVLCDVKKQNENATLK